MRIAQARCGLDQRIEYPLQIERRPADDLQDIGGGRLLFQGFCQLALACLLSLKQPRVLNGYNGLVGKRGHEPYLPLLKGAHSRPDDDDDADYSIAANEGYGKHSPPAADIYRAMQRVLGIL